MRIAILYNIVSEWDRVDIDSVMESVASVQDTLTTLGHHAAAVSTVDRVPRVVEELARLAPDVVFNLCEGYGNTSDGEYWMAGLLELLGLPYTGAGPLAMALALEKPVAKRLFAAAGMPTPAFAVYSQNADVAPSLVYPLILKLVNEDASVGITRENVVADEHACLRRLNQLLADYTTPVLVEEFIDGREFTVAMLDRRPIALEEIEFDVEPRIVCYRAKWEEGSPEDLGTRPVFQPQVTDDQRDQMFELAIRVWDIIGLRDYGRVDFRMDANGRLYILEANPNPDISPGGGYRLALNAAQIPFSDFVAHIVDNAFQRRPPSRKLAGGAA